MIRGTTVYAGGLKLVAAAEGDDGDDDDDESDDRDDGLQ